MFATKILWIFYQKSYPMSDEYDQITAEHYRSFRPPLHELILKKCISEKENYALGLDIGCGTGQSSVALSKYCKKVIGIDPSNDMLSKTLPNSKIEYQNYDGQHLKFEKNSFDIITFAGSLYYAKSQKLLDEVVRILRVSGLIVVYDFEILLDDILQQLQFESSEKNTYDHETDFSGLKGGSITPIKKGKEKVHIGMTAEELAHLLLSVKAQYAFFEKCFGKEDLHQKTIDQLNKSSNSKEHEIYANLYYKTCRVSK